MRESIFPFSRKLEALLGLMHNVFRTIKTCFVDKTAKIIQNLSKFALFQGSKIAFRKFYRLFNDVSKWFLSSKFDVKGKTSKQIRKLGKNRLYQRKTKKQEKFFAVFKVSEEIRILIQIIASSEKRLQKTKTVATSASFRKKQQAGTSTTNHGSSCNLFPTLENFLQELHTTINLVYSHAQKVNLETRKNIKSLKAS